jgi:hypothetical protein
MISNSIARLTSAFSDGYDSFTIVTPARRAKLSIEMLPEGEA